MSTVTRWQDIEDEKEKYAAYLCSREWAEKREAVKARTGGKCERCLRSDIDCVHHLTYIRKYEEDLRDLQGLCNGCHDFIHGKSDVDPMEDIPHMVVPEIEPDGVTGYFLCPLCRVNRVRMRTQHSYQCGDKEQGYFFECRCANGHWFEISLCNSAGHFEIMAWRFNEHWER